MRTITLLIGLLFAGSLQAQLFSVSSPLQQGDIMLGGSLSFGAVGQNTPDSERSSYFLTVTPLFQWVMTDRLMLSAHASSSFGNNQRIDLQIPTQEASSSEVSSTIKVDCLFPVGPRFSFIVGPYIGGGGNVSKNDLGNGQDPIRVSRIQLNAGISAGALVQLNDVVFLKLFFGELGYLYSQSELGNEVIRANALNLNIRPLTPGISVLYRFGYREASS